VAVVQKQGQVIETSLAVTGNVGCSARLLLATAEMSARRFRPPSTCPRHADQPPRLEGGVEASRVYSTRDWRRYSLVGADAGEGRLPCCGERTRGLQISREQQVFSVKASSCPRHWVARVSSVLRRVQRARPTRRARIRAVLR
jgi:hypothetical protein